MAPATIVGIAEDSEAGILVRQPCGDFSRAVGRPIVDDDELPESVERDQSIHEGPDGVLQDARLVVEDTDHRDIHGISRLHYAAARRSIAIRNHSSSTTRLK